MHENGCGMTYDMDKAQKWYTAAAERGSAAAQFSLGALYETGHGVKEDLKKAITLYRQAADQGFKHAQKALARLGR